MYQILCMNTGAVFCIRIDLILSIFYLKYIALFLVKVLFKTVFLESSERFKSNEKQQYFVFYNAKKMFYAYFKGSLSAFYSEILDPFIS